MREINYPYFIPYKTTNIRENSIFLIKDKLVQKIIPLFLSCFLDK